MEHSSSEFLQSDEWLAFQSAFGRPTFRFGTDGFRAGVVEHTLPIVGKYWYVPRGPIVSGDGERNMGHDEEVRNLIFEAKKRGVGWIRIEPESEATIRMISGVTQIPIRRAPHDMQPRETLVLSISSTEEEIIGRMKSKTRYNIRLAERKGVRTFMTHEPKYREAFIDLVRVTAERDGITVHSREYYETMFATLPESIWELFVAECDGKILAANLIIFWGETATYLHGASSNEYREYMAPYLLQWSAIREAKRRGCTRYDLGGVRIGNVKGNSWAGITRFKQGLAPDTEPVRFTGSYDIVLAPVRYGLYTFLTNIKKYIMIR